MNTQTNGLRQRFITFWRKANKRQSEGETRRRIIIQPNKSPIDKPLSWDESNNRTYRGSAVVEARVRAFMMINAGEEQLIVRWNNNRKSGNAKGMTKLFVKRKSEKQSRGEERREHGTTLIGRDSPTSAWVYFLPDWKTSLYVDRTFSTRRRNDNIIIVHRSCSRTVLPLYSYLPSSDPMRIHSITRKDVSKYVTLLFVGRSNGK